jgi:hypothetical protein
MERFQNALTALILVIGAIVLVAMVLAATERSPLGTRPDYVPEWDNPTVLRVYDVPTERAQDIRTALSSAMSAGTPEDKSHGRVTLSGTNQLVVLAPLQTQASVEKAVAKLGGGKPAAGAAAEGSVRLTVWLVDAVDGAGADDALLADLAPALEAARGALGAVRFRLHDGVAVSTIPNGSEAKVVSGRGTQARAHLRPIGGGVQAELFITGVGPGSIETTTALPFGQTIVLARLAAPAAGGRAPEGTEPTRLYIVRAEPSGV